MLNMTAGNDHMLEPQILRVLGSRLAKETKKEAGGGCLL